METCLTTVCVCWLWFDIFIRSRTKTSRQKHLLYCIQSTNVNTFVKTCRSFRWIFWLLSSSPDEEMKSVLHRHDGTCDHGHAAVSVSLWESEDKDFERCLSLYTLFYFISFVKFCELLHLVSLFSQGDQPSFCSGISSLPPFSSVCRVHEQTSPFGADHHIHADWEKEALSFVEWRDLTLPFKEEFTCLKCRRVFPPKSVFVRIKTRLFSWLRGRAEEEQFPVWGEMLHTMSNISSLFMSLKRDAEAIGGIILEKCSKTGRDLKKLLDMFFNEPSVCHRLSQTNFNQSDQPCDLIGELYKWNQLEDKTAESSR